MLYSSRKNTNRVRRSCPLYSDFHEFTLERRDVPAVSIYAQVGQKVLANSYNVGCQMGRDVATDANGVSTVVWTDGATWTNGLDGDSFGIYARKIDANGIPIGSQFRVNQRTTGCQTNPVIGLDGAGNAVVAYSNCDFNGAAEYNNFTNYDVRVQRMNADNTRGAEIVIPLADNYITDPTPQIQVAADGSFTVAYRDGGSLCLRHYAADNTLVSSQKTVAGSSTGSGETNAAGVPISFRITPDGSVMAISGLRVSKFIVDVGYLYQDRITVDTLNSSGVARKEIVFQSGWEDTANSLRIHGSGSALSIQPLADGGYLWFNKLVDGEQSLLVEKHDANGVKTAGPTTLMTGAESTPLSLIVPGTTNVMITYGHYTPWVGSNINARILDVNATPLSDEFFLLQNRYGDALKFGFVPGQSDKFVVTWNDEHPWLPSGDDSANGVPLVRFDSITPNSVISFAVVSDTESEGAWVFGYDATLKRTGELRAAPYTVLVTASSPDLPSSQFKSFQQVVEFAAGESSKTVNLKWIGDAVQTPTRHITLKLSDPTGTNASLGALTDFTLNLLDDDAPPNVAPTIQLITDKTIKAGETLKVQPVASDTNVPAQKLTFSLTSGPSGAIINPDTGAITWVGTESITPYLFRVKVTDNGSPALSASTSFNVTVNAANSNTPPVFQAISDKTVIEGDLLIVQAPATDADSPAQTLTYSLLVAPVGATINAKTGEIRWTAKDYSTLLVFQVQVTDNGSPALSGYTSFNVTVTPKLATLPTQLVELNTISSGIAGFGSLFLKFSRELNSATATNLKNYKFISAGKDKKFGTKDDKVIAIKSLALVKTDNKLLSVQFKSGLPINDDYRLTVTALKDKAGLLVDGDRNGSAGGTLTAYIRKGVVSF